MSDPLAYFITWATYGTWLPGDERGWVEYRRGWQLPDPSLKVEAAARMTDRTNHLHLVVSAPVVPRIVRSQLKAWCTRKLKTLARTKGVIRENWWAERGSQRYINDERRAWRLPSTMSATARISLADASG
jgi:hypothetical protein